MMNSDLERVGSCEAEGKPSLSGEGASPLWYSIVPSVCWQPRCRDYLPCLRGNRLCDVRREDKDKQEDQSCETNPISGGKTRR
jgi:hypothetical protein